jgi:hypothetical protein
MLLGCGMFVAPVFYVTAAIELALRPDYDITRLPLSFLSLGHLGWIQSVNFLVTGALALLCAIGIRMGFRAEQGRVWVPALVGLYAAGMLAAGVFGPDPLTSAASGRPNMTVAGTLHMVAFLVAFWSLIAACFVMARRFAQQKKKRWAAYSIGSGLLTPMLVVVAMADPALAGLIISGAGLVLFGWLSLIAFEIRQAVSSPTQAQKRLAAAWS